MTLPPDITLSTPEPFQPRNLAEKAAFETGYRLAQAEHLTQVLQKGIETHGPAFAVGFAMEASKDPHVQAALACVIGGVLAYKSPSGAIDFAKQIVEALQQSGELQRIGDGGLIEKAAALIADEGKASGIVRLGKLVLGDKGLLRKFSSGVFGSVTGGAFGFLREVHGMLFGAELGSSAA
jgi:hypothetical protein